MIRDLIDELYLEAAPCWGCLQQVDQDYESWSEDLVLTDEDINAMYDEYIARKEG